MKLKLDVKCMTTGLCPVVPRGLDELDDSIYRVKRIAYDPAIHLLLIDEA